MTKDENDMVERVALLPCPFCGGEARVETSGGAFYVACDDCAATSPVLPGKGSIAAWNTRPALAAMSEPTPAMVRAGVNAWIPRDTNLADKIKRVWTAMARVAAQETHDAN